MRALLQSEAHRQASDPRIARRPTHTETLSMTFAGRFPRCIDHRRRAVPGHGPARARAVSAIPLKTVRS
ncbi:hypothetical protein DID96_14260 [Burkholderia sp. Bp8963]|nr:hypothetical protein DID96_14260 [Burkholderia sp. Bp8963]